MENLVTPSKSPTPSSAFWAGRRVFITGHTGFKGAWASLLLSKLGAIVHGFALEPPPYPSLFELAHVGDRIGHEIGDIRNRAKMESSIKDFAPEVVIHMAAQSLVRPSYDDPVGTYATNVMGTVNLLDAVRRVDSIRAVIIVTSDKCYDNREWVWGYRETDAFGGYDPYSNSKGCAELVTDAFRRSYFPSNQIEQHQVSIASVRAGNVIGGGDWAKDRIIPDAIRAFIERKPLFVRYPNAIRPWQHVLDPLLGYLLLARRMIEHPGSFSEGWNFGPNDDSSRTVSEIADRAAALWGDGASWEHPDQVHPHEANFLKLDCSKAHSYLSWYPAISFDRALELTIDWYRAFSDGSDLENITLGQIHESLLSE